MGVSLVVPTDLNDEAAIENMVGKTLGGFGGIDILVNNSGVAGPDENVRGGHAGGMGRLLCRERDGDVPSAANTSSPS